MPRRRINTISQRELALQLRWHIDQAKARGETHADAVRDILTANPDALRSSHVRHNLGVERLAWLAKQGLALAD